MAALLRSRCWTSLFALVLAGAAAAGDAAKPPRRLSPSAQRSLEQLAYGMGALRSGPNASSDAVLDVYLFSEKAGDWTDKADRYAKTGAIPGRLNQDVRFVFVDLDGYGALAAAAAETLEAGEEYQAVVNRVGTPTDKARLTWVLNETNRLRRLKARAPLDAKTFLDAMEGPEAEKALAGRAARAKALGVKPGEPAMVAGGALLAGDLDATAFQEAVTAAVEAERARVQAAKEKEKQEKKKQEETAKREKAKKASNGGLAATGRLGTSRNSGVIVSGKCGANTRATYSSSSKKSASSPLLGQTAPKNNARKPIYRSTCGSK